MARCYSTATAGCFAASLRCLIAQHLEALELTALCAFISRLGRELPTTLNVAMHPAKLCMFCPIGLRQGCYLIS